MKFIGFVYRYTWRCIMNRFNEKNVTISQVAAEAHVSMTTISRYLNGKYEYMSAETRQRISNVIQKLDYHPSNIARSLKSRSSRCIGCVIADIGSPFSSILLKGINAVCSAHGYQVLFSDADDRPEKECKAIQELLDSRVDGLIVNTTGCCDDFLLQMKDRGVPLVLADRCIGRKNVLDTVTAGNYDITCECMRHLHENGFEKVAFFTPGNGKISPRLERYRAYCDSMRSLFHVRSTDPLTFDTGRDSPEKIAEQLSQFVQQNPGKRLAVFCVNGVTMSRVLRAMRLAGIAVGKDFGICGFDDWEWASLIPPGITTIAKDSYAIGMKAAEVLLSRITGEKTGKPVWIELESRLCVRGSTDAAMAAKF